MKVIFPFECSVLVTGFIGSLQALEAIKMLAGVGGMLNLLFHILC